MGSVNHIFHPKLWRVILEGKSKLLDSDYIYQMVIGYSDDDYSFGEICEFISKENYEKLKYGYYSVKAFPYSNQKIIIFDENNNVVPLVKGKSDIEYTEKQKEYIKKLKMV